MLGDVYRDPMVAYIRDRLVKSITIGGQSYRALSETAEPVGNSVWFWTDDNAKALALLSLPAIRDSTGGLCDAVMDFVMKMGEGDAILRRWAAPQLQIMRSDPRDFLVQNSFYSFFGDLSRGLVKHSLRYNDGREAPIAIHSGNFFDFELNGEHHVLDVEDAIDRCDIVTSPREVTLLHESDIGIGQTTVGRLRMEYRVFADSPILRVRVVFQRVGRHKISNVYLTTGYDQLRAFAKFQRVEIGASPNRRVVDNLSSEPATLHQGPLEFFGLSELGEFGHSKSLYSRIRSPWHFRELRAEGQQSCHLHWVSCRYHLGAATNAPLVVEEDRLLIGGSIPDSEFAIRVLRDPAFLQGRDPSISYDYGAELDATGTFLLNSQAYAVNRPAAERIDEVTAWYCRHFDNYFRAVSHNSPLFIRGAAFTIFSLAKMMKFRGFAQNSERLRYLIDRLLSYQDIDGSKGTFRELGEPGYLDCQGAAILALVEAKKIDTQNPVLSVAIRRALNALEADENPIEGAGGKRSFIALPSRFQNGSIRFDIGYWVYKATMILRAMRALDANFDVLGLDAGDRAHIAKVHAACVRELARCFKRDGSHLEILTSHESVETNSETQPWALLALLEPCGAGLADFSFPQWQGDRHSRSSLHASESLVG